MASKDFDLHLKGYVGGYDFDRNYVDYVLEQRKDKPVHVLIDSLGGSLATALSIASAFKRHGDVTVHFVGMNASAATIASLGAKHISIDASAMYLVHKCSAEFFEWGNLNADELATVRDNCEAAIRDLNKLDNNVAQMYSAKCSKPQADLLELMKEGGWLTAKEAKEWGFVDEITDFDDAKPVLTDAVASAMAAAGMPIPNVPTDSKETLFERFLASIAALFKGKQNEIDLEVKQSNENMAMKTEFQEIAAVLNVDSVAADENGLNLTINDLQIINDELRERRENNQRLNEQLEAIKPQPAEQSTAVVEESNNNGKNSSENYVKSYNNARRLFDLVSK